MTPKRPASLAVAGLLAATALALTGVALPAAALAAGPHSSGAPFGHGARPAPGPRWHGGHGSHGGHGNHAYWGWSLGLALGVPWGLGWYDPWWGPGYYPPYASYAYGPAYPACGPNEDCMREQLASLEPAAPTTYVAPLAPGEAGGPTRRPLYLNYCDSARAWFPQAQTCPGGWRIVLPEYGGGS